MNVATQRLSLGPDVSEVSVDKRLFDNIWIYEPGLAVNTIIFGNRICCSPAKKCKG